MTMLLKDFFVSETNGFLLENPLTTLPAYFEPWNRLTAEMPQLVADHTMRQQTLKMELLDWTRLSGYRQKRLAHLQLAIMAIGYVWQDGDRGAAKVLPACVAVPLWGLSKELSLAPILTHADLALANHRPIDPSKPLELDNLSVICSLPGGKESEWFVTVTFAIELAFGKGIKSVLAALDGVKQGDEQVVTNSLVHLADVVNEMHKIFTRMHENLSTVTFFNKLRPFLGGWGGEDNPLPDGLIYEGVSDQPVQATGGSAAQSGTLQVLDALLGVQHSPDKKSFLMKMRSYMTPGHQRFIAAVESQSQGLQSMVEKSTSEKLCQAYNALVSAIVNFRSYHIQIVTKYVVQAALKVKQAENTSDSLDHKGTGGTDLLPFLRELRQDTRHQMMPASPVANDND